MDKSILPEAGRACAADLQLLATHGVQRALAARMTQLTVQQARDISGGAYAFAYDDYCGNGIIPFPRGTFGGTYTGRVVIINGKLPEPYLVGDLAGATLGF
jgi:hypothetical protein